MRSPVGFFIVLATVILAALGAIYGYVFTPGSAIVIGIISLPYLFMFGRRKPRQPRASEGWPVVAPFGPERNE